MILQVTNAFHKLNTAHPFQAIGPDNKVIIGYEGSSRSSKTHSILQYLLLYSQHNASKEKTIRIFRDDRVNCMGSVYEDFTERLKAAGQYDERFLRKSAPTTYHHFGNRFIFMGLDDAAKLHGPKQSIAYFNEALDIDKGAFQQVNQRTTELTILDWNPKTTIHWVYDLEKRDNSIFLHATYRDNAFIPKANYDDIMAYCPWNMQDLHLPKKDRRPHTVNIENGTADEYMWEVYGMGIRASHSGLVYPDVTWIDEFPSDVEDIGYGIDFGHTNHPTAIVKGGRNGNNLYFELKFYIPEDDINTLYTVLSGILNGSMIVADSAEPGLISDLRHKGIKILAANKFNGSVLYGIDLIKSYKIHIVRNLSARKEQENYVWRTIGGIPLNEPVKAFDDFWDACRYLALAKFRRPGK